MPLQTWIHHWEEGAGARVLKGVVAVLAFIAVAALYDLFTAHTFSASDAMESAQLARNISKGKGYTTDSIRPLALYLLVRSAEPGQSTKVLAQRVPDLSNPPVYPMLLAGLMKVFPFQFTASQTWTYGPERWINVFNQGLFFVAVLLLFRIARRLFDARVAWLSAILFAGTNLFWKFSVSGLSTLWLIVILLAIVWIILEIERRERETEPARSSLGLALIVGALVGIGGLSRYAFAWMLLPVVVFVWASATRGKAKLFFAILAAFFIVMAPWVARNFKLSGNLLGTAGYSLLQNTPMTSEDTLERSTNPQGLLRQVGPFDITGKLTRNLSAIMQDELPKFGDNWISAFFLAGLLIPFRSPALRRLRYFLVGSLILMAMVQALGQTHLSADTPQINSENLLVLLAPLVFAYGASFFYVLFDQLTLPGFQTHSYALGLCVVILCVPLIGALVVTRGPAPDSPYAPTHLQRTAQWMGENEVMMSDIPWAIAWYGDRSCVWLSLNDDDEFSKVKALKPVRALFLTQRTTNGRYLSEIKAYPKSWGDFVLQCAEHEEVRSGFPLRKAPAGFLPDQLFLSDQARWRPGFK